MPWCIQNKKVSNKWLQRVRCEDYRRKVQVNLPVLSFCSLPCCLPAERSALTWRLKPGNGEKLCSSPLLEARHSCEKSKCFYVIMTLFHPTHLVQNTERISVELQHPLVALYWKAVCPNKHSHSRFLISLWLKAGVPPKVSRSSGFHNTTLTKIH